MFLRSYGKYVRILHKRGQNDTVSSEYLFITNDTNSDNEIIGEHSNKTI